MGGWPATAGSPALSFKPVMVINALVGLPFLIGAESGTAALSNISGLPDHGHKPLECSGQAVLASNKPSRWPPTCTLILRHWPGLAPNRRLKHVLKRPKWLNPHCSATLITLASGSRNKDTAFSRRISILSAATEKPKC